MPKFNPEYNLKTGKDLGLNLPEAPVSNDDNSAELQEGVWYFLESGVHTKNGNSIIRGEYRVLDSGESQNTTSAPQLPDQG